MIPPTIHQSIEHIRAIVKEILVEAEPGHDWLHVERVWHNALLIMDDDPNVNRDIVELAVVLHDIADSKFNDGDEDIGPEKARKIMIDQGIDHKTVKDVIQIIQCMSFKNSFDSHPYSSIELHVVQDADKLDAIGAVGIARAFTFGGHFGRRLYDVNVPVVEFKNKEEYKKYIGTTINHFYEKLLKLSGMMKTDKGKDMALQRHDFMLGFLDQFSLEIGQNTIIHPDDDL